MSFWFLQDLFFAVLSTAGYQDGTAFGAHVGGFVAGMGLGFGAKTLLGIETRAAAAAEEIAAYQRNQPATIYLYESGSQIGPFTHAQVMQMRTLGSIGSEAVYWQEGMDGWQSVNDL